MPLAARCLPLPPADFVLCSDAALAKAFPPGPGSRLVCYCHAPMRYAWDLSDEYVRELPAVLRPLWKPLTAWLRAVDRRAAQRVDLFIANSRNVAERILRNYGRPAEVVYPPVALPDMPALGPRDDFYLCVGHHVGYKRLDLAVEACRRLKRRLVVIGEGPDVDRLRPTTDDRIQWLGRQPDSIVREAYASARALLFPGEEDFGLVPVEAQGWGCPVVAYGRGGALETVEDGHGGVLFADPTVDSLCEAIVRFETLRFDPLRMHAAARRFSPEAFERRMLELAPELRHRRRPA
jgi:glycosyltransferase involved in cell wall biosynthesis